MEWRKAQWEKNYQFWDNEGAKQRALQSTTKVKRAYVTFELEEAYKRCLKYFSPKSIGKYFDDPQFLLEGKQIQATPAEVN